MTNGKKVGGQKLKWKKAITYDKYPSSKTALVKNYSDKQLRRQKDFGP